MVNFILKLLHHQVKLNEVNCRDTFTFGKKYSYYIKVYLSVNLQYHIKLIYHLSTQVVLTWKSR